MYWSSSVYHNSLNFSLRLGGPQFCQGDFNNSYSFDENATEKIEIILCGFPEPTARWKFDDSAFNNVTPTPVNSYTFKYSIQLPQLTQKMCGKELAFEATGGINRTKVIRIRNIFLNSCK